MSVSLDRQRLERDLRGAVAGEVRFSAGDRGLYATGGSNYRLLPIGVVIPKTIDDVVAAVGVCHERGAPVLSRGGGTSLAGQIANTAVVLDFSKHLHRVLEIDPERRLARVEPGCVLDRLRREAEREHGLTFGPDPSTHDHCTFGGMIGNNACGVRSVMAQLYGPGPRTSDNVHELEVLLYDGTRLRVGQGEDGLPTELRDKLVALRDRYGDRIRERYPDIPRRVSGYNLDDLLPENGFHVAQALAGTEGTCVTVLEATVHLLDSPRARSLLALGYEDAFIAADHVLEVLEHKPLGLEGFDDVLIQDMTLLGMHPEHIKLLPEGRGWLLVEFGGETHEEADEKAHGLMRELNEGREGLRGMKLFDDAEAVQHVWEVREAGLAATAFIPGRPDTHEGWEDSAVPPARLGEYLRRLRALTSTYGYESALYGHFGQGCVHARWNFDLTSRDGIATFRRFLDEASDLVLELGGSLSGEHGDGQSRAELLPKMFGDDLVEAFREFKAIWDPEWKMNPGKVVDAYGITDHLRLGTSYHPPKLRTHFAYREDGGSFAHAAVRCVGVGKCRREQGGVMCPSYMVTREEKHSTRGRAHLLWEMLNGDGELPRWRSREVFEALDLCLACKGCTNECPVRVDLPTYKAEFLAHYYARRLRPLNAYAFGLIDQAARIAARTPRLANAFARSGVAKRLLHVAPSRSLPAFASRTLKDWFFARPAQNGGGEPLVLWADTFANYFVPEVGIAAVEVLEEAGFHVTIPREHICCGRPLYDYGLLGRARRYLERVIERLRPEIRAGVPVVGTEPSCVAVFKDELCKILPDDEDAKRLARQTFHFGEFLAQTGYEPRRRSGRALLHGHCHQRATHGLDGTRELLEGMGLDVELPDSGCCGMAGSWGYERPHYEVSMACGERVLFPAVRRTPDDALLVSDGFSCRNQIDDGTGREALHVAQVLRLDAGSV